VRPVVQTRVGETAGNCFQAAVASVLELECGEVPEQPHDDHDGDGDTTFDRYCHELDGWLRTQYGLRLWWVPLVNGDKGNERGIELAAFVNAPPCPWIAGARVNDRYNHALVCVGTEVRHDPSPTPMAPASVVVEDVFLLVPDDPAAVLT
jgi:hypothetical protein